MLSTITVAAFVIWLSGVPTPSDIDASIQSTEVTIPNGAEPNVELILAPNESTAESAQAIEFQASDAEGLQAHFLTALDFVLGFATNLSNADNTPIVPELQAEYEPLPIDELDADHSSQSFLNVSPEIPAEPEQTVDGLTAEEPDHDRIPVTPVIGEEPADARPPAVELPSEIPPVQSAFPDASDLQSWDLCRSGMVPLGVG